MQEIIVSFVTIFSACLTQQKHYTNKYDIKNIALKQKLFIASC